jgi:hypothetical protein
VDTLIRLATSDTQQNDERTLIVQPSSASVRVQLKRATYHCRKCYEEQSSYSSSCSLCSTSCSSSASSQEITLCTSKVYTVVNNSDSAQAIVVRAHDDDKIVQGGLTLQEISVAAQSRVTLQNYKNLWYVVSE